MPSAAMAVAVLVVFILAVVVVGWLAQRQQRSTVEDYFLASRSFGVVLLLLAVLGTNISAFAMLGAAGLAYHVGIGFYWVVGASLAVAFPLMYFLLGHRIWMAGQLHGHATPVQLVQQRFNSRWLGLLVLLMLTVFTVPYVVVGQMGAGLALETASEGRIPFWAGSLLLTIVVGLYVVNGGMRGTALTNAVQVATFTGFLVAAFVAIPATSGGFEQLTRAVAEHEPDLLRRGSSVETSLLGALLQSFTFAAAFLAFPQVFMRILAAKSSSALRRMAVLTPVSIAVVFVPVVALSVWGAVLRPGLEGREAETILFQLVAEYLHPAMGGLALAALLAVIMSTMDSQALSLATMFTLDLPRRVPGREAEAAAVRTGRWVVIGVLAVCFTVSLVQTTTVITMANLAFTGFATVTPVLWGALRSQRMPAAAAWAALAIGAALTPLAFFGAIDLGPLPALPIVVLQVAAMTGLTLLRPRGDRSQTTAAKLNRIEEAANVRVAEVPNH